MKYELGYSIIANNLLKINDTIKKLNFIDFLHVDIMDGNFVPELTIGPKFVSDLIEIISDKKIDVHLMVTDPINYINKLNNINSIIFHYESIDESKILEIINLIKKNNVKCGISISPKTKVELILPFIQYIDIVQIMTVEPGKCGQKLIPQTLNKIEIIRKLNTDITIQVDGGVNLNNISDILNKGANSFICGSSMLKEGNLIKEKLVNTL